MNTDPSERFKEKASQPGEFGATMHAVLESEDFIVCIGNRAYFNFGPPERKEDKKLITNKSK